MTDRQTDRRNTVTY